MLGRNSISPDQVAVRALQDGPFAPQVIFHDGLEISDKLPETLESLLKADRGRFKELHPDFVGCSKAKK